MTRIEQEILTARPSLRKILPVVFWQTAVFAVLSFMLGIGFLFWRPMSIFPWLAPNIGTLQIWGIIFMILGVVLAHGLLIKRWERLRGIMCFGLFMKLLWSTALLIRISDGGTFLIAALFIGLAALQAVVIIYYLPPDEAVDDPALK